MSQQQLTNYNTTQITDPILLAEHFAKSGYFKDANDVSKAIVKIVAGQELGFGPMASMAGFHIIQGKPTLSANLMAAAIKRSGKYNFKVKELNDKICSIDFFENGQEAGNSTFTIEEAQKAGTQNLQKFPKNMLYARALSNGAKWYCPDVLNGSPIYTPDELGADVNEDGEVISTPPVDEGITDPQLKKLLKTVQKLAELQERPVDNLQAAICETFKKSSLMELTKAEAAKVIQSALDKIEELTKTIENQ